MNNSCTSVPGPPLLLQTPVASFRMFVLHSMTALLPHISIFHFNGSLSDCIIPSYKAGSLIISARPRVLILSRLNIVIVLSVIAAWHTVVGLLSAAAVDCARVLLSLSLSAAVGTLAAVRLAAERVSQQSDQRRDLSEDEEDVDAAAPR